MPRLEAQFETMFDQFLQETPVAPTPVTPPAVVQGELFARLMLRGLPVMKEDRPQSPTVH